MPRTLVEMKRTKQVRVDTDVAEMLAQLAAHEAPAKSLPDFLSDLLRPMLRQRLARALDRARKAIAEQDETDK